jgi:hypothetical protein
MLKAVNKSSSPYPGASAGLKITMTLIKRKNILIVTRLAAGDF